MSMSGQRRLELERERREALRLAQVKKECAALLEASEAALRAAVGVAVQQLAAPALRERAHDLRSARDRIAADADSARVELRAIHESIHLDITEAQAQARAWTDAQSRAIAQARAIEGLTSTAGDEASRLGREAVAEAERGRLEVALDLVQRARAEADRTHASALDERVRRTMVTGLLETLREMGFVLAGPRVSHDLVVLEGRLASGRRARFEIGIDGTMDFDLDGYEGRSCAEDLEKVETTLRDRFGVALGPPQVVWKAPDRIDRSARTLAPRGRNEGGSR